VNGAEMWTHWKVDHNTWRRTEKIIQTDRVRDEEILQSQGGEEYHTVNRRKDNWIGHILRRNWLLKRSTEGKREGGIEVTERQGRRRSSYWITLRKGEDTGNRKRKH
jgi:hypothetical protein